MPSVTTRPDSRNRQFRIKVPRDLRERLSRRELVFDLPAMAGHPAAKVRCLAGEHIKLSLRTRDDEVATFRLAAVLAQAKLAFSAARRGPERLTHRHIVAMSASAYHLYVEAFGDEPGQRDNWSAFKAFNRAVREGRMQAPPGIPLPESYTAEIDYARQVFGADLTQGVDALERQGRGDAAMEARFGILASWSLMRCGVDLHPEDRPRLLAEIDRAVTDAAWRLKRAASGDYRPDPTAERFPTFEVKVAPLNLSDLFERWARETRPAPSTLATWRGVFSQLRAHLGHDDARRLTAEDVIAFKDALLAAGLHPRTVNDGHLAAMRSIIGLAVRNKLLAVNPVVGIKVAQKTVAGTGKLPYTDEEVARLLTMVRGEESPARRWLPWLAALTGARIGEVAQLWGSHIREEGGISVIDIKPAEDGGTLKNASSERTVPIHPLLIGEGFLEFVRTKGGGPLFYGRSSGRANAMHASKGAANHLAGWIRTRGFSDPRKAPNHALRHWFKSALSRAGVADGIADALQGHAGRSEADTYRHYDLQTLAKAVATVSVMGMWEVDSPAKSLIFNARKFG